MTCSVGAPEETARITPRVSARASGISSGAAARTVRRDANEHLKKLLKDKLISEDEERRALEDVQKTTDAHIAKMDQAAKAKEKDILDIK